MSNYNKLILLLCGFLALLILCYLTAFRKTINEKRILVQNREFVFNIGNAEKVQETLINRISILNSDIVELPKEINIQEKLLGVVNSSISEKVKLIEIPKQEYFEDTDLSYFNQSITVQGNFKDLLIFLRTVEKDNGLGMVCSADFYKYNNKKTGTSATRLKLYLQLIIPKER